MKGVTTHKYESIIWTANVKTFRKDSLILSKQCHLLGLDNVYVTIEKYYFIQSSKPNVHLIEILF